MKIVYLFTLSAILLSNNLKCQEAEKRILDSEEIPFKMVKNTILIPISINNKEYQFVFDTGGILSVSEKIRNDNNLITVDSIEVSGINSQIKHFDRVAISEVKLGALNFKNRKALVVYNNSEYPEYCFEADGMIGRDFF